MNIIKSYAVKNLCYLANKKMRPQGIVVHSTGANNPMLNRYVDCPEKLGENKYNNHWNQPKPGGREVCVHAFIGYDKNKNIRVAEILPLNICCWGVGNGSNGSYNYSPPYIQFEICEDNLEDEKYYRKVFDKAIEYSAMLCEEYGINVDNIVGHCEAYRLGYGSNHSDPEHWMKQFGETMDDFRKSVSDILYKDRPPKCFDIINGFFQGDLVSIAQDAVYYDGRAIPSWVKSQNWYIRDYPVGDRAIIDENESKTNSICSAIDVKYLTLVRR